MKYEDNKTDNDLIFFIWFYMVSKTQNRIKSFFMASYGFLIIFFQNGLSLPYKHFRCLETTNRQQCAIIGL